MGVSAKWPKLRPAWGPTLKLNNWSDPGLWFTSLTQARTWSHWRGEDQHTGGGARQWIFFGDTIKFDPQLKNKILVPCGKTQPKNCSCLFVSIIMAIQNSTRCLLSKVKKYCNNFSNITPPLGILLIFCLCFGYSFLQYRLYLHSYGRELP